MLLTAKLVIFCSVISQGKVVALDRWGGKWNHLSMPHIGLLTTNYAKNYCNRTRIVKVTVKNVVTCFFGTRCIWSLYLKVTDIFCQFYALTLSRTLNFAWRSSEVLNFDINTQAYATYYCSPKANLVLFCRVLEIFELLYAKSHIFCTHPFEVFPLDPWCRCPQRTNTQAN